MLVKQANSFRSIDDLLQSQQDPAILTTLLQKKKKLLLLAEGGQLTADKYLIICKKIMAEATMEDVKNSTEFQMVGLGDDVGEWFKEVLDETRDKLEDQAKLMAKLGVKIAKQQPKIIKQQPQKIVIAPSTKSQPNQSTTQTTQKQPTQTSKLPQPTQPQPQPQPPQSSSLDIPKIYSLKVLDTFMQDNSSNKQLYINLYEQKQKILQLIKDKKINAQLYMQGVEKLVSSSGNQDVVFSGKMELEELKEFHQGDLEKWFRDRLDESEEAGQSQKQKYSLYKTGKSVSKQSKNDDIDIKVQQLTTDISKRAKQANLSSSSSSIQPFCFYYLDQQMRTNIQNKQKFCQLYEQKLKYLEMLKNQQVTAEDYRDMIGRIIAESDNQELQSAAQMEVDLHDVTGDFGEFFQGCVEDTGACYEEQEKIYNQYTAGKGAKLNLGNTSNSNTKTQPPKQKQPPKQPKPQISQIVSFTVLVQLLQKHKKDYDYCTQLKQKGSKLLKLVQDKKLQLKQYMKFLQTKLQTCNNKEIVGIMKGELGKLQEAKDGAKVFRGIVGEYVDKVKVNLGNRASYDSEVFINQMTVNQATPNIKIQYLLRKLGKHQSLYVYYKKNNLTNLLKQFQKQYKTATKNTLTLCQKLKNKEPQASQIDLHEFTQHNLPNITFSVLNRESRTSYNEKLSALVEKVKKSSVKIGEYMKGLKKGTNRNNVEQGAKMIQKNNKIIAYLEALRNEDFVPFPEVQEVKVEMYNLDLNKNLTENQIQIKVLNFEGVKDTLLLRIYMIDRKHPRFEAPVADGPQKNIDVIIKIPPEIMEDIIKGSDKKYLYFTLVSKGWFSQKLVGQADLQLNFIRTNRMQDKLTLKHDKIFMDYQINVLKPKKPLVTEIPTYKLTEYPKYQHDAFVQKQFIKTIMPFQKPTASQIKQ